MDTFIVKASTADGSGLFLQQVPPEIFKAGLRVGPSNDDHLQYHAVNGKMEKLIYTFTSPSFDSINYWFLKKSLNIFGEAILKTIAFERTNFGSTDTGVSIVKQFWSKLGIEKSALRILDGSGLSPSNRVTTNSLVKVMLYAKSRPWFDSFYYALPEMNGIKMKDGYISGTRSYTGYVSNKSGQGYVFSFIVNNFDGDPANAREKIWKVLNIMK
jgi:D-alanyl-D-alanine carboxypeptidase/D-alanyl-D-alanine-endopeptidase (penicillin-binding protein 4)